MEKLFLSIMTAVLLLSIFPMQLKAVIPTVVVPMNATIPVDSAQTNVILARLNEIKAMDKSKLSSAEKKQLRKELRTTKKELKASSGGVYLSVGAILIIILLLILLL